jgi:hypothetical protein
MSFLSMILNFYNIYELFSDGVLSILQFFNWRFSSGNIFGDVIFTQDFEFGDDPVKVWAGIHRDTKASA